MITDELSVIVKGRILFAKGDYFRDLHNMVKIMKNNDLSEVDTIVSKGILLKDLRDEFGPGFFNEQFQTQIGFNVELDDYIINRTNNKDLKVGDPFKFKEKVFH
jgi:hypothetical protein